MCGVTGAIGAHSDPASVALAVEQMTRALEHRGPDEGGVADVGFGVVGMRRLSIVDVSEGHQPMWSPDGRWCIVYNGEIYDHLAKRPSLKARGFAFRTRSDTETLLADLICNGEQALARVNGMFAFAIVDKQERTVMLARDRRGIKPLYYYLSPTGALLFSSELKSLVVHPDIPRQLDHDSLGMLLVDRYVSAPWTMFRDVFELPPGTLLTWRDGAVSVRSFAPLPSPASPTTEGEAVEMLDEILSDTVRSQLVADVPVGVFLSGGIDSSTVAAYAAAATSNLRTFSVGFASDAYDESGVARQIAQYLGTDHTEIRISSQGFDDRTLNLVVDHFGQPLGDPSCIPTYLLARETSKHLKCVLSGDGGDEFFGGYNHIRWASQVRLVSKWPMPNVRRLAAGAVARILQVPALNDRDWLRRLTRGLEVSCLPAECQLRWIMSLWRPEELRRLLKTPHTLRPSYETAFAQISPCPSFEEEAMRILSRTYLPGAILPKVDRMSMAAGLEVRVPLLDDRVTAFAEAVSPSIKLRGAAGKHLLRRVARDKLPRHIFSLPKRGFSIPLSDWFNERFWTRLEDLCAPGSQLSELFHHDALQETLSALRRKRAVGGVSLSALATRSWLLAQLGVWLRHFRVAL